MFKSHKDKSFFVSDQVTQTSMFASPYRLYATENVGSANMHGEQLLIRRVPPSLNSDVKLVLV